MIETAHREWAQRLARLEREFERSGDEERRLKGIDLLRKTVQGEWSIAFCGHFSAGKSTLLNHLLGEDLLPTSPIPTSANVVKITAGENRVKLFLSDGRIHAYDGTYTDQELKDLCKNGEEILAVHIQRQTNRLPAKVALMDTPGIDSTDAAHERATRSSLHLADVIFYVMDYNHVQAEGNLEFIKQLIRRRKRVYLIINQIDKHREEELSFSAFCQNVQQSFADWGVNPEGVFYTSMRDPLHPHNQFAELKKRIGELIGRRFEQFDQTIRIEAEQLLKEHMQFLEERDREQLEKLAAKQVQPDGPEGSPEAEAQERRKEMVQLKEEKQSIERSFDQGLEAVLQNAYLMPYEVRALAEQYLETQLTSFKVGFFFSKGKTEKEKERRTLAFLEKLGQTVETQLDLHVKQYVVQFLKEHHLYTEDRGERIYSFRVHLDAPLLAQTIKPGAGFGGNYVLTYTDDLANKLKQFYRQAARSWFGSVKEELEQRFAERLQQLERRMRQLAEWENALSEIRRIKEEHRQAEERLLKLIRGDTEPGMVEIPREALEEQVVMRNERFLPPLEEVTETNELPGERESEKGKERATAHRMDSVLAQVHAAEEQMKRIPGLTAIVRDLARKRERLERRQYTVALFGAFSAGKSSFANALIGKPVLPVSPHPTTATINRICPPTGRHPHGQAVITFKTGERLLDDLRQVYKLVQQEVRTLEEAVARIGTLLDESAFQTGQKTALPFLQAVRDGFSTMKEHLGGTLTVKADAIEEFVARETKSCFVESVDLYYDSPLTRQGITLVDTPGADSMHARHTDVAFQYIKSADALLYVTYYNHPFSKADREFLIQLGRVKDVFSLDKMFFIINAADLAASREELAQVEDYIRRQLSGYGIREPRLFSLSSLRALAEKAGGRQDPQMERFEQRFSSFILDELRVVSIRGLTKELRRGSRFLRHLLQTAEAGREAMEKRKGELADERDRMRRIIQNSRDQALAHALGQEVNELLYYVKQRLFSRYRDEFPEIFNPSVLRSDDGQIKQKLRACVLQMVDFMRRDLLQELRATSLRMERWLNDRQDAFMANLTNNCLAVNGEIPLVPERESSYPSPDFPEPLAELSLASFKKAISCFKNAKTFFEKNEKEKMREEMEQVLEPAIAAFLDEQKRLLTGYYLEEWQKKEAEWKEKAILDAENYYDTLLGASSAPEDLDLYRETASGLAENIAKVERLLS
ncbi:dynamin family protein [Thermoactinomyces sp. CICC 10521]|uniref:dynamin family protein n=1 Tax=Thermoactinomyces sp. CICC 10521 TaxID=2767426 RepID=UPI0018DC56D1|nr:dynamin family protein [Thermoactinomyces sp. CICC 10521]MBH8609244.1 dynamin family protein [Thermoactinomyces sp. CICC 10521]